MSSLRLNYLGISSLTVISVGFNLFFEQAFIELGPLASVSIIELAIMSLSLHLGTEVS